MEKEKKKSVANIWKDFSQSTGFHAVNKVSGGSKIRGLIWCSLLIACACYMIFTVSEELKTYYSYQSVTSVEVKSHMQLEFPSITFCNLNPLSKAAMKNDSRIDNYHLSFAPELLYILFSPINWSDPFYQREDFFENRNITEVLSQNKPMYELYDYGYFDREFIYFSTHFSTILTPEGPCLTSNLEQTLVTSQVGSEFNLELWLNVDRENSYYGSRFGEGVKVIVHDKREDPFFHGPSGFYVQPGNEYYASMKKKTYSYLPRPFKAMADSYCRETSIDGSTYVLTQCWKECYVRFVYSKCSCLDFKYKDYPICSKYAYFTCIRAKLKHLQ